MGALKLTYHAEISPLKIAYRREEKEGGKVVQGFLSVDPIVKESESPYAAFSNNPIWFIDPYGADTTKPNALGKLDDVLTGGQMKNQQKVQMLEAGIKNQVQGITINKNLKEQAFNDLLNSTAGSDEFKSNLDLYNDYQSQEQNHSKALGWMLGELYKAQKHDDNIQRYNEFVNTQIDLASVSMNGASIVASLIPSGGASGFFLTSTEIRASLFSARGGYGLFGKKGLRVGGYKIEAMYANEVLGTGTIFSIKQVGKQGGNLLRWDYGMLHGTQRIGLHSSFRLNLLGKTFGSTKQYPGIAPFKFWKYPKP